MAHRRDHAGQQIALDLEVRLLESAKQALDQHDAECEATARVILLNEGNWQLLGWDELLGIPVLPSEEVVPMTVHVVCGVGRAGKLRGEDVFWDDDGQAFVRVAADNQLD